MACDLLDRVKPTRRTEAVTFGERLDWDAFDPRYPSDTEVADAICSVPTHYAGAKFEQTMRHANVTFNTANTNLDGTGTIASIITGVANGTRVTKVWFQAIVSTTAGLLRIFLYDGTNHRMIDQIPVPVITLSTVYVKPFHYEWIPAGGVLLPSTSHILKVATYVGESFNAVAEGWDF